VTRLRAVRNRDRVPVAARVFSKKVLGRLWGLPSLLRNGYRSIVPGVKQPRGQVDNPSSSTVGINKEWSYTSTPIYALMVEDVAV
jgi:hypothetical protein